MSNNDLLIRQKCEEMIAYGYVALRQFPKFERHVLAAEMRHAMWEVLRLIVVCNKRYHKKTTLQDLDAQSFGLQKSILHKAVFIKQLDHQTKCTVLLPKIEDITNVEASIK